jgi:acetyl-CoA hydrolase
MRTLAECIESAALLRKVVPVEAAVELVEDGDVLAVSGFTKSAEPKVFLPALARRLAAERPEARITLYSGASLSEEVEGPIAPFVARRGPYMSSRTSRRLIHEGKMDFSDVHLSMFARNFMYGFYGDPDLAVVEVSRIRDDGSVILTSAVGISAEALHRARRIVLEVATAGPDYTGFHDIHLPPRPPDVGWPIPVTWVGDRVGAPYAQLDPDRVVAVVASREPDHGVPFAEVRPIHRRIAQHIVDFLVQSRDRLGWKHWLPPLQSGVGNVANAIVAELHDSPFRRIAFWTEVFQDGMLKFVEDRDRFTAASATGLSFSTAGGREFERLFAQCRDRVILRPMWLSNSPEIIGRLFVIAMNTPLEVDVCGQVNSTHVDGRRIVNGLGGSGDFFRNAYLSIAHTPSVRRLRDGRVVSCVMPVVNHVDHGEHDIKCICTEQGFAVNTQIRDRRRLADDIVEHCAHPHFRPLLREWLRRVGDDPPRDHLAALEAWWRDYDAACRAFPAGAEV